MYPSAYFSVEYFSLAYWLRAAGTAASGWFVQLTDLDTVQELPIPVGARSVLIQPMTQDIRWRMDGGNPTSAVGMLLRTTDPPREFVGAIQLLRFIEANAGAKLNVQFK